MRIGCIMDPIESVGLDADTTFHWLLAAQARGHELVYIKPDGLTAKGGQAWYQGSPLEVRQQVGYHYALGDEVFRPLSDLDICWMRKDPPFESEYLFSTYVLELADEAGDCWVLNKPSGLRDANEKAYILHFPEVIPDTIVTHQDAQIRAFMRSHGGVCVIKPLDGHGGSEVFILREDDLNHNTIIEVITRLGKRYVMVQEFLPEAREGDKRILLMGGEPLGGLLRVPKSSELRGNLHVGGKAVKVEITDRDREIIAAVGPRLRRDGLYFVGLDVIGGRLTEVNVTSPTGIQEMSRFDGINYSDRWITWQEEQLALRLASRQVPPA